jgi:hypothetical protein
MQQRPSHICIISKPAVICLAALPTTLSGSEFSHYFGITETGGPQTFKRSYAVHETVPRTVANPRSQTDLTFFAPAAFAFLPRWISCAHNMKLFFLESFFLFF